MGKNQSADSTTHKGSNAYVEYLDKETTIMGILSVFSVSTIALVLNTILTAKGADKTLASEIWNEESPYILSGSAALMLAALFFYRERSRLAFLYGQICLSESSKNITDSTTENWLLEADSWETWIYYRWAFGFMFWAFFEYGCAASGLLINCVTRWEYYLISIPAICLLVYMILSWIAMTKHKHEESAWRTFFHCD